MADHSFGKRIPFAYLFEVCKKFEEKYGKEKTFLHTYEASEFEGTMAELMVSGGFLDIRVSRRILIINNYY